jgi:hypothetical protein
MRNIILFILCFLLQAVSCKHSGSKQEVVVINHVVDDIVNKPFVNANLIYGSSFGHFYQELYRQNRYEEMIRFTCRGIKEKYSKSELVNFYNSLRFGFELGKLGSSKSMCDTTILVYPNSNRLGTRTKTEVYCVLENDTVRFLNLTIEEIKFVN